MNKLKIVTAIMAVFALTCTCSFGAEKSRTFSLRDSMLLFDEAWDVVIVSPAISETIPLRTTLRSGPPALPSISANGAFISSGFAVADDERKRWKVRCAVAVYSRSDKLWRTYGDFHQVHATAISPDGSQVAFLADDGELHRETRELLLLRLSTGQITKLATITGVSLSWSPNAQKLAIGLPGGTHAPQIKILDIHSGDMKELVEGLLPAWSPSGQWIAYVDPTERKIHLVHPDGTADRVVSNVSGHFFEGETTFGLSLVWSPDETQLLANRYKGANLDSRDVVSIDIKTGRLSLKLHNGDPIFGWISPDK